MASLQAKYSSEGLLCSSSGCSSRLSSIPSRPSTSLNLPSSHSHRRSQSLVVRAAKLPSGVEAPKEEPKLPTPLWGFTENAERWNSRAAMIGIIGLFVFELIIQKGILQLIGFEVGKGLNIPL